MSSQHPRAPVAVCLTGPTAAGKSAVAMAIAAAFADVRPVEIVSVDSAQVYVGMDIGTAKPGRAERAAVPHHLLDIVDAADAYSAARFVADARRSIGEINARGGLPLLVGGTMLYLKALFDGLDALPAADPAIRAMLQQRTADDGIRALHAELARVDPVTAARLPVTDTQRIQRALEVFLTSGTPLSSFHGRRPVQDAPAPLLLSLEPHDRGWLHDRIRERFTAMLDAGLVDEVERLRARGDLTAETPSMRCVGYRQAWAALDAGDLAPLAERGAAATRQLAKRQLTWLRSMSQRIVIACDEGDPAPPAIALLRASTHGAVGGLP